MQIIKVDPGILQDAFNIQSGAYAPLSGFLKSADFFAVLEKMRLADGAIWSIPMVVPISEEEQLLLAGENAVEIFHPLVGRAVLTDIEVYPYDKKDFCWKVYGTDDPHHPGVASLEAQGSFLLGGRVAEAKIKPHKFTEYALTPADAKKIFSDRGWKKIVGFQTRNVPHRAHEFLQTKALEQVDGLFIHPVIGEKKLADFKDEFIISSYEILIDKYHTSERAVLGVLPLKMRYAGPREAIMHALVRKNFGCTHFVVGRDHAGVGDYYHPEAAQKIFDEFDPAELGIEILKFGEVGYNEKKKDYCFRHEAGADEFIPFSGTKLRKLIMEKTAEPPEYLIRPEIYEFLASSHNSLVDDMYKQETNNENGFVLWFTGLSGAGKSTIADAVFADLQKAGVKVERLDGDIARQKLTKGLGFSKEDRDENIRRIGVLADQLSRGGVGVVASFISPYREQRSKLRQSVQNFIEVFINTPLEVCESRDPKGLYRRARAGEIKGFTGIDDPYEEPANPDVLLAGHQISPAESVQAVMDYLKEKKYI